MEDLLERVIAINGLLADPELRTRLGRAGREWVLSRFDQRRMIEDNLSVYERLVGEQVQATIIDRRMRGAWEKRGSKSLIESANQRADQLLKTHEPKPLPEDLIKELKRIVKSAE